MEQVFWHTGSCTSKINQTTCIYTFLSLTPSQMWHTSCSQDSNKLFFICSPFKFSSLKQCLWKFQPQLINCFPISFPSSFFFLSFFLGLHMWHMEVPRLGVKSEIQLPAYTTATVSPDLSCIFDLHHSSWQHQILNPLSEARDQTHILMDTSQICCPCATTGTPSFPGS